MPGKFNAHPVIIDGYKFDSRVEGRRYNELMILLRNGDITGLQVHPRYTLQEGFMANGKRERAITYEADFSYIEGDRQVVEDVKGGVATQTDAWKIKRKLFLKRYPQFVFRVIEVCK